MSILQEILEHKRGEVEAAKQNVGLVEMKESARSFDAEPRGFRRALIDGPKPAVIAEIKRCSPSKGEIRPDLEPVECARSYAAGGAAALSVLTDQRYFGGKLEYLEAIRKEVELPLLRKDFIVDSYQLYEARVAGADAVLLIVAALEAPLLGALWNEARELGLDVLVEVHDEAELEIACALGVDLIGINNRNLKSFETDLAVSERLLGKTGSDVVTVSESGIFTHDDIKRLARAGAQAFLVGESLMQKSDPGQALLALRGIE